jgi:hypothetical protein
MNEVPAVVPASLDQSPNNSGTSDLAEWEAYLQGSHGYMHSQQVAAQTTYKPADSAPAGSWDPLMAGAV